MAISALLGLATGSLNDSLTHQTITARGQSFRAQLSFEKANYARDAIAKVPLCVTTALRFIHVLCLLYSFRDFPPSAGLTAGAVQPLVLVAGAAAQRIAGAPRPRGTHDCHGAARHLRLRDHAVQQVRRFELA